MSKGFSLYRESSAGLAAARRFGENVSIGLRFNYNTLKIAGYGQAMALTADAALLLHLSSRLHFGIQVANPAGGGRKSALPVPSVYSGGLGYEVSDKLFFSAEIIKEQSQPVDSRFSMQYILNPLVLVRTVIHAAQPSLWFGAGFFKGKFRLDVYNAFHLRLGLSGGMVLYYHFRKRELEEVSTGN